MRLVPAATFRARVLRRRSTPAERVLWDLLRSRRLCGAKFRRQVPLGPFFADFFCHEARLVIEADGGHHPTLADPAREDFLRACGYRVLRFPNDEILTNTALVAQRIAETIRSPSPSGRGGRG
jgi:adenine-specific DNA-methyltransferase